METGQTAKIHACTIQDFYQIQTQLETFWGSSRTSELHHPMFVYEFGNTSFVMLEESTVIAYLFGFLSQTENTGYVHLVGVRDSHQRKGLGTKLYEHFCNILVNKKITCLKAITTPSNEKSIRFHLKFGMEMTGEPDMNKIKLVKNYSGIGQDRVVFKKKI